jgi:cell division protein FtsX
MEKSASYPLQGEGKIPLDDTKDIKKMDNVVMRKATAEEVSEKKSKVKRLQELLGTMQE